MRVLFLGIVLCFCSFIESQSSQEIYKNMQARDKNTRIEAMKAAILSRDPVLQQYALESAMSLQFQDQQKLIPGLLQIYPETKEEIREQLLSMLSMILPKTSSVIEILNDAIENGTRNEKQCILLGLALERKNASFALSSMLKIYHNSDDGIRELILERLGNIGNSSPKVMAILKNALKDKNPALNAKAAFALGEIGEKDPAILSLLKEKLSHEDPAVLSYSLQALGKLLQTNQENLSKSAEEIAQILWKFREHKDVQVRIASMLSFAQIHPKKKDNAVNVLLKELSHDDTLSCLRAAYTILLINPKESAAIKTLLKIARAGTHTQAISFMGKLGLENEEIIAFLQNQAMKTTNSSNMRVQALFALYDIAKSTKISQNKFFEDLLKEEKNPAVRNFLEKVVKK